MSDQFSFEEEHPLDWLKETSQFTYNNHSLHSDLSKDHFLDDLLRPRPNHPLPSHTQLRQRNKVNSKNYRDRKKGQFEHIRREVEQLRRENEALRNQKHCRWCRKPYSHPVLISSPTYTHAHSQKNQPFLSKDENFEMEAEFQKPQLIVGKRIERKGKIWIALGILLLVLGVTLHGFEGDKREVKEIEIYREQMARWSKQLESKEDQYFQVKMRLKQQSKTMGKGEPGQLRIVYKGEEPQGVELEDNISINKELLYGIHAELDDIGVYL